MQELGQSMEDYLESILVLSSQIEAVHNIDIASYLGFSKSSVSHALKVLQKDEMIRILSDKSVVLTEKGKEVAIHMYSRHTFFTEMLEKIGVAPRVAEEDACRLEHVISEETFQAIKTYYSAHKKV